MTDSPHDNDLAQDAARGHESSDVPIGPLAAFLAALTLMLAVVGAVVAGLFWLWEGAAEEADSRPLPLARERDATPSGPLLQESPSLELAAWRAKEDRVLHALEWVDRDLGVARIPIGAAIELTAKRGLPKWPAVDAPPSSEADAPEGGLQ